MHFFMVMKGFSSGKIAGFTFFSLEQFYSFECTVENEIHPEPNLCRSVALKTPFQLKVPRK